MSTPLARWGSFVAVALAFAAPSARAGVTLPGGTKIEEVDFERHVMGVLGRYGCASGSCHGSFQGKGGVQLSLFGYDPAMDFQHLVRANNGRRVNPADPDASLMLLKATGQVPHEGRTRFGKDTWAYQLVREWIAQGAKRKAGSGEVKSVRVLPGEYVFAKARTEGQLKVEATFADGSKEDITALCEFRSNDDNVVEITGYGGLKALRPGDTAVIVSYRGNVVPVRAMVPFEAKEGFVFPKLPEANYIDREVFSKLKRLNMVPSDLCSDGEFVRRVYLDTIGTLPTADEARKFIESKDAGKREKLIDELLRHPMHAALWATKFCDITGNNTDALENPQQRKADLSQMWHDWFRTRVEKNVPYDQIVKGVLTATSREGRKPADYLKEVEAVEEAQDKNEQTKYAERDTLDLFWRRQLPVTTSEWGEKTAAAFLGVRMECAQCHKHPFDRWTMADYRAYANVFATLNFGIAPDAAKDFRDATVERAKKSKDRMDAAKAKGKDKAAVARPLAVLKEVFVSKTPLGGKGKAAMPKLLPDPETGKPLPARTLGGPEVVTKDDEDPREALWRWMASKDNPFFARSFANRVWGHYFGVGIVHPVDDFSLANPASNDKLLDALAADFVASKFDLRALEKRVLMSRTYQLSSTPTESNRFDKVNYARGYVRPLMAEVVVDVLNAAMGTSEKWGVGEARPGARAIEVGASRVTNPNVNALMRVFGRPARAAACDCERTMDPALPQKLTLLADPNLYVKLKANDNRLGTLLKAEKDDDKALEELFLATLSRFPTQRDKKFFADYKADHPRLTRREVFNDVLYALMNTTEFIFNH